MKSRSRVPLLTLTTLLLALTRCDCPGPGPVRSCNRLPTIQTDIRSDEPHFENQPTTFRLQVVDTNCPALSTGWQAQIDDPNNEPIAATAEQDTGHSLVVSFNAGEAGAYHVTLLAGSERTQFELNIVRDRRDAGSFELPAYCAQVQRTAKGLIVCSSADGGTIAFDGDGGTIATFRSPVEVSGNALWSWTPDDAARLFDDGVCLRGSDGGCATGALGVAHDGGAIKEHTAIAPTEDLLHVVRIQTNFIAGSATTHRADGGIERRTFNNYGSNGAFVLVPEGDRVHVVIEDTTLQDALVCRVDLLETAIVRDDACPQTLLGANPCGQDLEGVFTRGAQNAFWRMQNGRFTLAASSPDFWNAGQLFVTTPHQRWPVSNGYTGKFDYVWAVEGDRIIYEVYSLELTVRGADRNLVWTRAEDRTKTKVFIR